MKIDRKQLVDILALVLPGVMVKTAKTKYNQYDSFVFYDNKIISYNDNISIFLPFQADFKGAVVAKEFYDLVKSMKSSEIDISMDKNEIFIKTNNSRSSISVFSDIKLPFDNIPKPSKYYNLPDNFLDGLDICYDVVSKDNSDEIACYISIQDNHMIASDCYRIIDYKLDCDMPKLFIPYKIAKLLKQYKPNEIAVIKGWLLFKNSDDVIIATRTISSDEEFMVVIDETNITNDSQLSLIELFDFTGENFIFPNEFKDAVMSCRTLTKSNGENELVEVFMKDSVLNIRGFSDNKSKHHVRFKTESNSNFNFAINPTVLISALKLGAEFIITNSELKIQTENFRQYIPTINEA